MAVVVREQNGSELNEYNGLLASGGSLGWEQVGTTVYAPVVKKNNNSRTSHIFVANAGTLATTASINFYNSSGTVIASASQLLAVNGSYKFDPPNCALCSAVIASPNGQPLAVAIREQEDVSNHKRTTHNAFSAGATTNFLPLVKKNPDGQGQTTRVAMQNVGTAATNITLTCYPETGNGIACGTRSNVPAKATAMFVMNGTDGVSLPSGFVGSAVATSSGQPIA